jgi:hypothetical protein
MSKTRVVACIGDGARPDCRNLVRQARQPDGTWVNESGQRWPFCEECDEVYEARKVREGP